MLVALFIFLLVLKLLGLVAISWWLVTAPLWVPVVTYVVVVVLCVAFLRQ